MSSGRGSSVLGSMSSARERAENNTLKTDPGHSSRPLLRSRSRDPRMPGTIITGGTWTRSMPLAYSLRRSGVRDCHSAEVASAPARVTPTTAIRLAVLFIGGVASLFRHWQILHALVWLLSVPAVATWMGGGDA